MDTRPREERDLADFYDNIDESLCLPVFVTDLSPVSSPKPKSVPTDTAARGFVPTQILQGSDSAGKLPKAFAAHGFRHRRQPRPAPHPYIRAHVPEKRLVNYDMDEQDQLYLAWLNQRLKGSEISPEAFETVMSKLEQQWYDLEVQMIAVAGPGQEHRDDLKLDENFEKYGSDDGIGGTDSLSEQRCAVCNDSECDNTNAIVFCDGCNIAVHQECYGIAFIPEGQWFCRRCMVARGLPVACAFCPSKTGAFKQLDNGVWSHVVCALWINEVYFANPIYLEPIEGVGLIPRNRWKLLCYICKQRTGACIQCTNRSCFQAYHVTCAKRAGLYMAMEKGMQGAIKSKSTLKSFCDKHTPHDWWGAPAIMQGISKTRMFYRDCHLLSQQNDRLAVRRRQENQSNIFKWKTEHNTPIAPQHFADSVFGTLKALQVMSEGQNRILRGLGETKQEVTVERLRFASAALCRYWCLKREARRGSPLTRIPAANQGLSTAATVYYAKKSFPADARNADQDAQQVRARVEFGTLLLSDLHKLVQITDMTVKRQKLMSQRDLTLLDAAQLAHFPTVEVSRQIMDNLIKNLRKKDSTTDIGVLARIAEDLEHYRNDDLAGIDDTVVQALSGRTYNSTVSRTADRAVEHWRLDGLPGLQRLRNTAAHEVPFSEICGLELRIKPHNAKAALEDAELSEAEEDPFESAVNRNVLKKLTG